MPDPVKQTRVSKRAKTPTVLQMEATECGAASLGIVLGYFGRIVPLEELRIECGISRDGSRASKVLKAARKYGLTAQAFRKEPAELPSLPVPMIVHWNFSHFLVIEGFGKNKVFMNDPARGPCTVTPEELDRAFSGVVLTFQVTPEFKKGGQKPSILRSLGQRLAGSETGVVYAVLASLALVLPGLAIPFFGKAFIDYYLVQGQADWVKPLLLGMGLIAIVRAGLTWLQQYYLTRLETKLALATSGRFFWHILHLPIEFYLQRYGGEIGSRVAINDQVAQMLSGQLATTILNLTMILFYLVVMFFYDVPLTLIGVSVAMLNLATLTYVSRRRVDGNRRLLQERGKVVATSMNGLQTIETIKAGGLENDFFSHWAGQQAKLLNASQELGLYTRLLSTIPPVLSTMSNISILTFGGLRIMEGSMTIGSFAAFQSLMSSFIGPFNNLVGLGQQLQEAEGNMNRLDDVLRYKEDAHAAQEEGDSEDGTRKLSGHLELRDICFGYSRLEPPLIQDFNLTLKPGSRVAIVGGSGSGKSTIAKIVAGLYEPWSGEILLDGKPRHQIPRRVVANSLALVDQDIFVFSGTIRENLSLWDYTLPDANMIQAAKDACIHDDIALRSGGYDSLLQEGGGNFSGGQRQRLEIARALAANPTILVLDEATSALDPVTEKMIDEQLRRRGCTCLIIAHRLSTLRDADEIIVLERGKAVQRGKHEEMIRVEGPYRRLVQTEELKAESQKAKSLLERLL